MAQSLNLGVALGASKTGLSIGYTLLDMDGTTQQAFTTTNVVETSVAGSYVVTVPVIVADAGARIGWGVSGTTYFWGVIDAALNNLSAAQVNAEVDTALADVGLTTTITGRIDAAVSTRSTLTAQQVWEYGTRTLSGFGTLVADIWAYATRTLTQSAAQVTAAVSGPTLNITRAATYSATLTGLTVPSGWTSARWTVKRSSQKASIDGSTALIQILVSATPNAATDGLVVLNGSDDGLTLTDASLSISGTTATITIADHVTAVLDRGAYEYDIKFYYGSSASTVVTTATCNVVVTPTQTV